MRIMGLICDLIRSITVIVNDISNVIKRIEDKYKMQKEKSLVEVEQFCTYYEYQKQS